MTFWKRQNYSYVLVERRNDYLKKGNYWHYRNILYLDCGGRYMTGHFEFIVYRCINYIQNFI